LGLRLSCTAASLAAGIRLCFAHGYPVVPSPNPLSSYAFPV
jgi:hypothetical protein